MTTINSIARKHLGIKTLETQNSDGLDFHEVSVWGVKAALTAALELGRTDALRAAYTRRGYATVADVLDMGLIPAEVLDDILIGIRTMPDALRQAASVLRDLESDPEPETLSLADDIENAAHELEIKSAENFEAGR